VMIRFIIILFYNQKPILNNNYHCNCICKKMYFSKHSFFVLYLIKKCI
jgi:hypothetical protein